MSDKFKYTVGLNNVGSYQVAGSPYVTSSTVSQDTEQEIQFPRVTNNVTVKLDSAAGQAFTSLHLSASDGNLAYSTNDTASVWQPGNGQGMSLSVWLSGSGQGSGGQNGIVFGQSDANTRFCLREKDNKIQLSHYDSTNNARVIATGVLFPTTGWIHLAGVVENDRLEVYVNGLSVAARTTAMTTNGTSLYFPYTIGTSGVNRFDGEYKFRDAIVWDAALSDAEVFALYQASSSYSDSAFSAAVKLAWMKPTNSVGEIPPAINSLTNHGISGSAWILGGSGSGETIEISSDSPFASGGSGGELRIHYRSTGSLPNVANNKHYWTLSSQDEEIKMNVKTKEIYLSAVDGDCDFSLHADLTNIPASRMYQHTGSGVDE